MSYTIEYGRVFLKSEEGYTPLWLAGSNNVTEPTFSGRERRAREWGPWCNMVGVSEQELMDMACSMLGSDEHWKRGGQWVDDAGLIRWIQSGVKSAVTMEELLRNNRWLSVYASARVYGGGTEWKDASSLHVQLRTTEDLDKWVRAVKEFRADMEHGELYPSIDLPSDRVNKTRKTPEQEKQYLIKRGKAYLTEFEDSKAGRSITCSYKIQDAKVFTGEEAADVIAAWKSDILSLVDASLKTRPYNVVIRFDSGPLAGRYFVKCSIRQTWYCYDAKYAKHYPDKAAGKAALKRLEKSLAKNGATASLVEVEEQT